MASYWGSYELTEGEPQFESRMKASRLLVENVKTVKGHPLMQLIQGEWHTALDVTIDKSGATSRFENRFKITNL